MYFIGCDPDLSSTALAAVTDIGKLRELRVFRAYTKLAMIKTIGWVDSFCFVEKTNAFAVEAQEIYPSGPNKTKNPGDILHLSQVAGALLGRCFEDYRLGIEFGYFPLPVQWKGSIPKIIHHRRILNKAGIPADYVGEAGGKDPYCYIKAGPWHDAFPNKGDWKHLCDAIGLAQYAAKRYSDDFSKTTALAKARS